MNLRSGGEDPALSVFSDVVSSDGACSGALPEGVLAVHAHPDDETLSTGGLLATFAAAGLPVRVVTCTRGERGEVIALPGTTSEGRAGLEGDGPALGAYRETELGRALVALGGGADGAVEQVFLDTLPQADAQVDRVVDPTSDPADPVRYEDSGMAWVAPGVAGPAPGSPPTAFARVPLDEPAGRLAVLIRTTRPAVVATYEPGGGYRHPDHVRAHEVTVRAVRLAADPAWRPGEDEPWAGAELWLAVAPAAEVRAARATLAGLPEATALAAAEGLTLPDPHEDLPPFAKDDLPGWSAERQVIGSSNHRSPDELPITSAGRGSGGEGRGGERVVRVDVGGVLGRVVAAMRAHATQVQHATALPQAVGPVAGWYALSNRVLAPVLMTETYVVVDPLA